MLHVSAKFQCYRGGLYALMAARCPHKVQDLLTWSVCKHLMQTVKRTTAPTLTCAQKECGLYAMLPPILRLLSHNFI